MPVALKHVQLDLSFALGAELHLEELSPFVGDNIERVVCAPTIPRQVFWTNDAEPRAHTDELIRDRFRVHDLISCQRASFLRRDDGTHAHTDFVTCDDEPQSGSTDW